MSELPAEIVQRIENLERSYRWWKGTGTAALIAAALLLVMTVYGFSQRQPQAPPALAGTGLHGVGQVPAEIALQSTTYANFCRVTGTPEELVLDFGLNTEMQEQPVEPVKLTNRLVLSYYTVKRLASALQAAVQQHEAVYGIIEVDANKRAQLRK